VDHLLAIWIFVGLCIFVALGVAALGMAAHSIADFRREVVTRKRERDAMRAWLRREYGGD
jgi:hypothetical protein